MQKENDEDIDDIIKAAEVTLGPKRISFDLT